MWKNMKDKLCGKSDNGVWCFIQKKDLKLFNFYAWRSPEEKDRLIKLLTAQEQFEIILERRLRRSGRFFRSM